MNLDDQDFYGHGHKRLPIGPIAALLLTALLVGAMAWSESNAAATYRAQLLAREEMQRLGIPPDYSAQKKKTKRKDECVSWSALVPGARGFVVNMRGVT